VRCLNPSPERCPGVLGHAPVYDMNVAHLVYRAKMREAHCYTRLTKQFIPSFV
jgi:hypothetical protein